MAIKVVQNGKWNLVEVPEDVRLSSPLRDPDELKGVGVHLVNAMGPFVIIIREPPNHYSSVHYHSASEAMIVLQGRMLLNGEWCGTGAVIYIDQGGEYWHATDDEGCVVALVRPDGKGDLVPGADSRLAAARERLEHDHAERDVQSG